MATAYFPLFIRYWSYYHQTFAKPMQWESYRQRREQLFVSSRWHCLFDWEKNNFPFAVFWFLILHLEGNLPIICLVQIMCSNACITLTLLILLPSPSVLPCLLQIWYPSVSKLPTYGYVPSYQKYLQYTLDAFLPGPCTKLCKPLSFCSR